MATEARAKEGGASLAERLLAGDKRALARGISFVENDDPQGWALVREAPWKTSSLSVDERQGGRA